MGRPCAARASPTPHRRPAGHLRRHHQSAALARIRAASPRRPRTAWPHGRFGSRRRISPPNVSFQPSARHAGVWSRARPPALRIAAFNGPGQHGWFFETATRHAAGTRTCAESRSSRARHSCRNRPWPRGCDTSTTAPCCRAACCLYTRSRRARPRTDRRAALHTDAQAEERGAQLLDTDGGAAGR